MDDTQVVCVKSSEGALGEDAEWTVIELQGTIVPSSETSSDTTIASQTRLASLKLGQLQYENNLPVIIVGYHRLEGKKVAIKKPFAVLEKIESDGSDIVEYKVVGIVKSKIIFKTRPKPIVDQNKRKIDPAEEAKNKCNELATKKLKQSILLSDQ